MNDPGLLARLDALIAWYWQFGCQRRDAHALNGPWLDRLYQARRQAAAVSASTAEARPRMAVWGPSQTGKSTLLSAYFDNPAVDDLGDGSPLQWSQDEPVRFVVGDDKSDRVIVLNPFNLGSDASGCVTRFTLRDVIEDPAHPVEIELADETQILHALAVGYLSECRVTNARGETVAFDADSFRALLERQKIAGPPTRAGYEAAHGLADLIELLILSELEQGRYKNLDAAWEKSLRRQLLESPALLAGPGAVQAFAAELLWDGWPSLTAVFQKLAAKRQQLRGWFGDGPVRCSFRAAALLLDIGAYKKCRDHPAVRAQVQKLIFSAIGDSSAISQSGGSSGRMVDTDEDFGLFQSLIWQLTVPVRRDLLRAQAPVLCDFLETADLLDFPGVANAYGSADRLTDGDLAADNVKTLTEVLKRGKTASVVVTSARNLDIDGFSILTRVGKFPAQPVQLVAGLRSWLKSYGEEFPPRSKRLPINLVLTFSATLVNQVISSGIKQGLHPSFDQLKGLGPLAQPGTVTTFATNYPQFFEARFDGTPVQQREALDLIGRDPAFLTQFGDNAASFEAMAADGGRDYFFSHLRGQAAASPRPRLLADRAEALAHTLHDLRQQALPAEGDAAARRRADLDAWIAAMQAILAERVRDYPSEDAAAYLSRRLRALLNVDPLMLDGLPLKALPNKISLRAFIEKQFRNWQSEKGRLPNLEEAGLRDSAHAVQMLGYLLESTNFSAVETLLRSDFGYLDSRSEALHARRFLAAKMSVELLHGQSERATGRHRPLEEVKGLLFKLATKEDAQDFELAAAPHYLSVIEPFFRRLEQIKTAGVSQRPPQPGDAELALILG